MGCLAGAEMEDEGGLRQLSALSLLNILGRLQKPDEYLAPNLTFRELLITG